MSEQTELYSRFRLFVWALFNESKTSSRLGKIIQSFLFLLILSNVLVIIVESIHPIFLAHQTLFKHFELISVVLFTIEYFARIWASVGNHTIDSKKTAWRIRLRFMLTPMAIIDLIAILPFYLSMFFVLDLRFLRILRLVRILKLTRYSVALQSLISVLKEEMHTLIAAYIIMIILIVLASSGIYLLEYKEQPEHFGNIPLAMWWAVISLTTVGYGDVTPITVGGKIFGGFISLIGIVMVALPTGIIASGFGNVFRRKRQRFTMKMIDAVSEGFLTNQELKDLKQSQKSLGLSDADTHEIYKEAVRAKLKHHSVCPKCGASTMINEQPSQEQSPKKESDKL